MSTWNHGTMTITSIDRSPVVTRAATMDDVRMAIAKRCDALVGRQRRGYCPNRARIITELQASFDALTRALHG